MTEQWRRGIAAVVPAAGYSSRAGFFKPLLPAGPLLVIERSVGALQQAGVAGGDISVVVGHRADLLVPVLTRLGVKAIRNPEHHRGMYSSIQAGIRSLGDEVEAFFLLPADCAFVSPRTIDRLAQDYRGRPRGSCPVIYPVCRGERGHPPLISATLRPRILAAEPEGGLGRMLEEAPGSAEVPVADEGVLVDLDSEEDYRRAIRGLLAPYPSLGECRRILQEHRAEGPVLEHSRAVAGVSGRIAEHLNSRGCRIHLGVVMAASWLHDLARGEKDHAARGSELVARLGYPEVADIIASHMALGPGQQDQVNEATIVYLADKLVSGTRVVSLDERLGERLEELRHEAARQGARERIGQAMAVQKRIEGILDSRLEDVLSRWHGEDSLPGEACGGGRA